MIFIAPILFIINRKEQTKLLAAIFQLYASPAGEHKETKRDGVLQRLLDAQPPHCQVSSQFILILDFTSDQGVQDTYQLPKISSISESIIFLKKTLLYISTQDQ